MIEDFKVLTIKMSDFLLTGNGFVDNQLKGLDSVTVLTIRDIVSRTTNKKCKQLYILDIDILIKLEFTAEVINGIDTVEDLNSYIDKSLVLTVLDIFDKKLEYISYITKKDGVRLSGGISIYREIVNIHEDIENLMSLLKLAVDNAYYAKMEDELKNYNK